MCNFCKKSGHAKRNYRRANRLCLACGSGDHIINDCVFRRTRNTIPVSSALSVPHIRDPVRLMCTLKATNHISLLFSRFNLFFSGQFNHFLPTLFVTIARRPITRDETIEWPMDSLACSSDDHSLGECPHRRIGNNTQALTVFPTPPVRGNLRPVVIRAPLPPQQQAFRQAQRGQCFRTAEKVKYASNNR